MVDTVRLMLFPALMAFAAFSDLFTMTISNRVSLMLVGGFLTDGADHRHERRRHSVPSRRRPGGPGRRLLLFACGWIGGGDAKLAAATALWLGFDPLMTICVYASLFGGVLTLLLLQFRTHAAAGRAGPARNG